ncbi:MAG: SDR family NAD(P)-dependent oxidoreductase [Caldiserica bacterium]|nr:SDR family NAD(P)-dependent oxidoreductase [Caldisericota bacterium]
MEGKVVVITGASSGLGFESAKSLSSLGATIALHGRSQEKLGFAVKQIRSANTNAKLDCFCYDLSLLAQTRKFAQDLLDRYPKIDVLMNNAGISTQYPEITSEGFEKTFVTNHLSHFLLTNLLQEKLIDSGARVINVSSCDHAKVLFAPNDLQSLKTYFLNIPYARSKLYNVMFTYELDRRLHGTKATVNALNPGRVRTGIGKNDTTAFRAAKATLDVLASVSVEDGAKPQIHLASSPDEEGLSGKYYDRINIAPSSQASYNQQHWKLLWNKSMEMCSHYLKG